MKKICSIVLGVVIILILVICAVNLDLSNNSEEVVPVNNNLSSSAIEESSTADLENNEGTNSEVNNVDEDVLEKINTASNVQIKEKIITLNKEYGVYIDGKEIATVSGKYVNITGDVFKLKDMKGNVLSSEKQIKRWGIKLNRLAKLMDNDEKVIGYVGEDVIKDFFAISKYKFHFYDENKEEYAYTKEKILSLLYEFEVYNTDDTKIYKVEKDFNIITDSYNITKMEDSELSMDKVIFLTCIVDSIMDSQEE